MESEHLQRPADGAGHGTSKDAALISDDAASGMHCRFPNGKRTPAVLDSEKQGYECDAPKVGDPFAGACAAVRSGRLLLRAHATHPGCCRPYGSRKAQPPFSNNPCSFCSHAFSLARSTALHAQQGGSLSRAAALATSTSTSCAPTTVLCWMTAPALSRAGAHRHSGHI